MLGGYYFHTKSRPQVNFPCRAISLLEKNDFDLSQFGSMVDSPVSFNMPANYTVDVKGAKSIFVKITGHEKCHFTVVLSYMADGTRLSPKVIFKR